MRFNLYAQQQHTLVIDGVPVTGFAEGDWLQVEMDGNAAQRTQGGDGPGMNFSVPQGGTITIGLRPTSPALGIIYELRDQQRISPRLFGVGMLTGVNEVITATGCAYGKMPAFRTGGPTMQTREILLECMEIKLDLSESEAIAGVVLGVIV